MTIKIQQIEISKINAHESWNVRSVGWKESKGDEAANEFEQLVESIKAHGVEVPITLRPEGGRSQKFAVVAGFRRLAAATAAGLRTIPAQVKQLTEVQARAENIRENTERENLSPPDLVFGVKELDGATEAGGGSQLTESELGLAIGKSQPYAGKLRKAAHGLTAEVLDKWRAAKRVISLPAMLVIAGLDKSKQAEAFSKLLKGAEEEGESGKKKAGKAGQADKLKRQAAAVGTFLGKLVLLGVDPEAVEWKEFPWDDFIDTKEELKGNALKSVVAAAKEAYEDAQVEEEDEEVAE